MILCKDNHIIIDDDLQMLGMHVPKLIRVSNQCEYLNNSIFLKNQKFYMKVSIINTVEK